MSRADDDYVGLCHGYFILSFRDGALAPDPESKDSGFDAEPVIGPAKRPDPLASPRNDECNISALTPLLSEDVNVRTALTDIPVPRSGLLAAPPYAPLPVPARALPETGARRFKPEFSCLHLIRPPSRSSHP